jgi:hypothetical protein
VALQVDAGLETRVRAPRSKRVLSNGKNRSEVDLGAVPKNEDDGARTRNLRRDRPVL